MHHVDRNSAARRTTMTCSTKLCHIYFKVQVDVFSCLSSVIRLCCSYNETISDILCRRTSKARMSRFVASASLFMSFTCIIGRRHEDAKRVKKLRRDTVTVFVCVYLHLLIILSKSHARPSQASYESNHLFKFCINFAEALMKRDVCKKLGYFGFFWMC